MTSSDSSTTRLFCYWDEFVSHYFREGKSEHTVRNVHDALKLIMKEGGVLTIEDCNNPAVLREVLFRLKGERNWSGATFNTYRKNINTYFLWLEDMEYIEMNKIGKIRKCKEKINEQYVLSPQQIKMLLGHLRMRPGSQLERTRNEFFVGLMCFTGARPCELFGLQCRDLQEIDGRLQLQLRGRKQKGRERFYKLPSWLFQSYNAYILARQKLGREEANLFVSSSKTTGWTQKGMRGLFRRLKSELKFRVTAYSIRRYVATKLYSEGLKLEEIADYLGHTRLTTTKRYIARTCGLTKRCGEVMGKII